MGNSASTSEQTKNPNQASTRAVTNSNRKQSVGASSSSTPTPTTTTSLKFIPKNQTDLSNLIGKFVSVNFIDVEAANKAQSGAMNPNRIFSSSIDPSSSILTNQIDILNATSFKSQHQKQQLNQQQYKSLSNAQALNTNVHEMPSNQLANAHQPTQSNNIWHDESASAWTSTGVMSDRSSVYSIDDGVCST